MPLPTKWHGQLQLLDQRGGVSGQGVHVQPGDRVPRAVTLAAVVVTHHPTVTVSSPHQCSIYGWTTFLSELS
jgi:hypothetical protein